MLDHRRETLELEKLNVEIRKFMAESRKRYMPDCIPCRRGLFFKASGGTFDTEFA